MLNKRQVTVTLSVDDWQRIMRFIQSSCQPKGDGLVKWGQDMNRTIRRAIHHYPGQGPRKKMIGYQNA